MAAAVRYDRSFIFRDAWARAKAAAAEAVEPVRSFLGKALRAAWASAKSVLAGPVKPAAPWQPVQLDLVDFINALPPVEAAPAPQASPARQHLLGQIEANDLAMARLRHEIDCGVAMGYGAGYVDAEHKRLDDLHAWGVGMREELAALEEVETAAAPDLSTTEGLHAALVGLSASLPLGRGEAIYTVTDITRWTSACGTRVRDYLRFKVSGTPFNEASGPVGVFVERAGGRPGHAALPMTTRAGRVWWSYGKNCVVGRERRAADKAVRNLLSAIDA